jgi:hypothetical protein
MKAQGTLFDPARPYRTTGATFSECCRYRYRLWRTMRLEGPTVLFIMLNPSTADDLTNDPTIERCERRAKYWGFGVLEVVNLFAWRATDPGELLHAVEPVGSENDATILTASQNADAVICAWGKHGALHNRAKNVLKLLRGANIVTQCLGVNGDGSPKHPLYLPYTQQPMAFPDPA